MARSNPRFRPSVTQRRRFVGDLAAMGGDDLRRVCDNLCEIANEGAAVGSLETLNALAYQLPLVLAELHSRLGGR
jgi:hypothetical protein